MSGGLVFHPTGSPAFNFLLSKTGRWMAREHREMRGGERNTMKVSGKNKKKLHKQRICALIYFCGGFCAYDMYMLS